MVGDSQKLAPPQSQEEPAAKAKRAGGKRGQCMPKDDLELIVEKFDEHKPIGAIKLMDMLPARIKKTALNNVLNKLGAGKTAADILEHRRDQQAKTGRPRCVTAEKIEAAREAYKEDNSSKTNSVRKVAKKVRLSLGRARHLIKPETAK